MNLQGLKEHKTRCNRAISLMESERRTLDMENVAENQKANPNRAKIESNRTRMRTLEHKMDKFHEGSKNLNKKIKHLQQEKRAKRK